MKFLVCLIFFAANVAFSNEFLENFKLLPVDLRKEIFSYLGTYHNGTDTYFCQVKAPLQAEPFLTLQNHTHFVTISHDTIPLKRIAIHKSKDIERIKRQFVAIGPSSNGLFVGNYSSVRDPIKSQFVYKAPERTINTPNLSTIVASVRSLLQRFTIPIENYSWDGIKPMCMHPTQNKWIAYTDQFADDRLHFFSLEEKMHTVCLDKTVGAPSFIDDLQYDPRHPDKEYFLATFSDKNIIAQFEILNDEMSCIGLYSMGEPCMKKDEFTNTLECNQTMPHVWLVHRDHEQVNKTLLYDSSKKIILKTFDYAINFEHDTRYKKHQCLMPVEKKEVLMVIPQATKQLFKINLTH